MKLIATLAIFIVIASLCEAFPHHKRMVYYQQPAQWYGGPQRLMYVQYSAQPSYRHAHSGQSASALVAGNTVATGTYLQDCNHAEAELAAAGPAVSQHTEEDETAAAAAQSTSTVAEAYPEANAADVTPTEVEAAQETNYQFETAPADAPATSVEPTKHYYASASKNKKVYVELEQGGNKQHAEGAVVSSGDELASGSSTSHKHHSTISGSVPNYEAAKNPREYQFESSKGEAAAASAVEPSNNYLPAFSNKRKVFSQHEQAEESQHTEEGSAVAVPQHAISDDDESDDDKYAYVPAKYPNRRPITSRKPSKPTEAKPLPAGTYFPVSLGDTSGAAVAIANAFSTGEGGSATSHAVAYGSPAAASARVSPGLRRH